MSWPGSDNPLIDTRVLGCLLTQREPITIESLALMCDQSRDQTLAAVTQLRAAGCRFDEHPQHGLRLIEAGLSTWADYLQSLSDKPRVIEIYQQTRSTQDVCRRLVEAHGPRSDDAIVATHEQTAGRGRLGRQWVTPPGTALTFSRVCVLDEVSRAAAVDRLTFATSVAVAQAVESLLGVAQPVQLKWPNDVYIDGRKLAGILVETFRATTGTLAAIIGVGLNVSLRPEHVPDAPRELRDRIISLAMCGLTADRLHVLGQIVQATDHALHHVSDAALLDAWRTRSTMLHHHARLQDGQRVIEGQVIDLDPAEGLIVRTAAGQLIHLPAATTTVL